jgi:hypothetical protein
MPSSYISAYDLQDAPQRQTPDTTEKTDPMLLRDDSSSVSGGATAPSLDVSAYDVIVVGGGLAGVGAAIGAKQASPTSRVLVVESEGCLGGAATHRGVLSFCGLYSVEPEPRRAVGAIWTEIHQRLVEQRAAAKLPDRIVAYVQVSCRRGLIPVTLAADA